MRKKEPTVTIDIAHYDAMQAHIINLADEVEGLQQKLKEAKSEMQYGWDLIRSIRGEK